MRRPKQLQLTKTAGWGGKRARAGRKPIPDRRRPVAHRARPEHKHAFPVHLTLRARAGLPSLRGEAVFGAIQEAIRASRARAQRGNPTASGFRVVHFSVQADHVHLIVEGADTPGLARGIRGLVVRMARAINRALDRRGAVWGDRYHARALRTPREVRNGLVYVIMNFRKHRPWDRRPVDPCSSASWFEGFRTGAPVVREGAPVCRSRTWLGSVGWRRHGLVGTWEKPAAGPEG
jgi:REP element-mobilizing transposase RayT